MMIKCKECKTIYNDNEKYCPFCFTRTNKVVRYRTNMDENRLESSVMKKRAATNFDYQKRTTTKYKKSKINPIEYIIPLIFSIIFFIMFVNMILGSMFFY